MNNPWNDIATPGREFNVRLVSEKHPLKLFWGKDVRGGYLFIIEFSSEVTPEKKILPELAGIRVGIVPQGENSCLVLLLNDKANWEIFKSLCVDLICASDQAVNHSDAVSCILQRLLRWHEFLKREKVKLLSNEAIKGLIGELLFLRDVLVPKYGWKDAVSFWKGPLGTPQDFAVHDVAVEVKAQSGISRPYVQISSLEQMDAQLPKFYLVVNTLATIETDNKDAFTLNSLVHEIKNALMNEEQMTLDYFETLLFQIGYLDLQQYDAPSYKCVARRIFRVRDDFPRMILGNVPAGVTKVVYQVSIDSCLPFEEDLHFTEDEDNDN